MFLFLSSLFLSATSHCIPGPCFLIWAFVCSHGSTRLSVPLHIGHVSIFSCVVCGIGWGEREMEEAGKRVRAFEEQPLADVQIAEDVRIVSKYCAGLSVSLCVE